MLSSGSGSTKSSARGVFYLRVWRTYEDAAGCSCGAAYRGDFVCASFATLNSKLITDVAITGCLKAACSQVSCWATEYSVSQTMFCWVSLALLGCYFTSGYL